MSSLIVAGLLQWLLFIVALIVWALAALAYRSRIEQNDDVR